MIQLIRFEFKKVFRNKIMLGALGALLVVLAGIFYINIFHGQMAANSYNNDQGVKAAIQKNITRANKHAVELTDENIYTVINDYIIHRQATFVENNFDMFGWSVVDVFSPSLFTPLYDSLVEERDPPFTIAEAEITPVADIGFAQFSTPLKMGNYLTWRDLTTIVGAAFIPLGLLLIFICANLFSGEFSLNMMPLISSTRFGRSKATIAKLITCFLLTVLSFLFVQGIILAIFSYFYGFSGWDVSLQTNFIWKLFDFPLPLNNLHVLLLIYLMQFLGLLGVTAVTCVVSSLSKAPISALAISLGLFFAPQILTQVFKEGLVNKLLHFFPVNLLTPEKFLAILENEQSFFLTGVVPNLCLLLGAFLLVKIIADVFVYFRMRTSNMV